MHNTHQHMSSMSARENKKEYKQRTDVRLSHIYMEHTGGPLSVTASHGWLAQAQ